MQPSKNEKGQFENIKEIEDYMNYLPNSIIEMPEELLTRRNL